MEAATYRNGNHRFTYCTDPIVIPRSAIASMIDILDAWRRIAPREPTYVQRTFNVPSLTVRFDGVLCDDGTFVPYELQPAGAGIGYAGLASESFGAIREHFIREIWPPFKLLQNDKLELDDDLWLERISLTEAIATDGLLQLRYPISTLDQAIAAGLLARSVKPVLYNLTKEYGVTFGWWKRVTFTPEIEATLPWENGFALKPIFGWGSYDVMIAHPAGRPGGSATRPQIMRTFEKQKEMFLQPFIAPMTKMIDGRQYNAIVRPFFGYDPQTDSWVPWGGTWNARPAPALRIHGSSDAIAGPLELGQ